MNIIGFLRSIDWPTYQVLFGFGYEKNEVDACIRMAPPDNACLVSLQLLRTRCLFSTILATFMLNRRETWRGASIHELEHMFQFSSHKPEIVAISIEIDVTARLDHMFTLLYVGPTKESPSGWYIIQSYVMKYHTVIEPIDAKELIYEISRWKKHGTDPSSWERFFHAQLPSTNKAKPHLYVAKEIHIDDLMISQSTIKKRIQKLLDDKDSYINKEEYTCILNQYTI